MHTHQREKWSETIKRDARSAEIERLGEAPKKTQDHTGITANDWQMKADLKTRSPEKDNRILKTLICEYRSYPLGTRPQRHKAVAYT